MSFVLTDVINLERRINAIDCTMCESLTEALWLCSIPLSVSTSKQLGTAQRVATTTVDARHRSAMTQVRRSVLYWTQLTVTTFNACIHVEIWLFALPKQLRLLGSPHSHRTAVLTLQTCAGSRKIYGINVISFNFYSLYDHLTCRLKSGIKTEKPV